MKNKKFAPYQFLPFKESRLIYMSLDNAPEDYTQSPELLNESGKITLLINALQEVGAPSPNTVLTDKTNPFLPDLSELAKKLPENPSFQNASREKEKIVLTYADGTLLTIDGNAYKAIFWNEIAQRTLEELNSQNTGQNFTKEILAAVIRQGGTKVNALVDQVAKIHVSESFEKNEAEGFAADFEENAQAVWGKLQKEKSELFDAKSASALDAALSEGTPSGASETVPKGAEKLKELTKEFAETFKADYPEGSRLLTTYEDVPVAPVKLEQYKGIKGETWVLEVSFERNGGQGSIRLKGVNEDGKSFDSEEVVDDGTSAVLGISGDLVRESIDEIEKRQPAARQLAKLQGTTERGRMKKTLLDAEQNAETQAKLNEALKVPELSDEQRRKVLPDGWASAEKGDLGKINPDKWDPRSQNGRAQMRADLVALGVPAGRGQDPYYEAIFNQLRKCSDNNWLAKQALTGHRDWYLNPENHAAELERSDPDFYKAWLEYVTLQTTATTQADMRKLSEKKLDKLDKEVVYRKMGNVVKRNFNRMTEAWRKGDWATVTLYGVGIVAAYKVIKEIWGLSPFGKDSKFTFGKILTYGAGAYALLFMAKTAGYDIPKMVGIKEDFAEVNGSALEPLLNIVKEAADGDKPLDADVYARTADIHLAQLYGYFDETDSERPAGTAGFIDPKHFPKQFTQFKGKTRRELAGDSEYKRIGEQLYLTIKYLRDAYNKTLATDPSSPYYGKSFEQALKVRSGSTVLHFTMSLAQYAPIADENYIWDKEKDAKSVENFRNSLTATGVFIGNFEVLGGSKSDMAGEIMRYPVVVRAYPREQKYYVFARADYDQSNGVINKDKSITTIPFAEKIPTTDAKILQAKGTAVKTEIIHRLKEDLKGLKYGGVALDGPDVLKFEGDYWKFKVKIKGNAELGINDKEETLIIHPLANGKFEVESHGQRFDMVSGGLAGADKSIAYGVNILDRAIAAEKMLAPLAVLRGALKYEKHTVDPADANKQNITLQLGSDSIVIVYDSANSTFSIDPAEQSKIIQNEIFIEKYVASQTERRGFREAFDTMKAGVDTAKQKGFTYFFESIAAMAKGGYLSSDMLSGSVPHAYAYAQLEAKKNYLLSRMEKRLETATSVDQVNQMQIEFDRDLDKLQKLAEDIVHNADKWERADFNQKMEMLQEVGARSDKYKSVWKNLQASLYKEYGQGSDLMPEAHLEVAKKLNIFAEKTAHLDSPVLDNLLYPAATRGLAEVTKRLVTPSGSFYVSGTPGSHKDGDVAAQSANPASINDVWIFIDGGWQSAPEVYGRRAYIGYVQDKITLAARQKVEPDIEEFKTWLGNNPAMVIEPMDPVDTQDPFDTAGLKIEFEKRLDEMVAQMIKNANSSRFKMSMNGKAAAQTNIDSFITTFKTVPGSNGMTSLSFNVINIISNKGNVNRSDQIAHMESILSSIAENLTTDKYWTKLTVEQRLLLLKDIIF